MAKINTLTKSIRGKAFCSKCGKEIVAGEKYLKATPYKRSPIIRCEECGIKPYETSGSMYVRMAGNLVYNWKRMYPLCDTVVDDIISDVESMKDDIESSLYNLPDQFQDGSILQDRLDSLDDCINELEYIDVSFYDDMDENDEDFDELEFRANERGLEMDISSALSNLLLR